MTSLPNERTPIFNSVPPSNHSNSPPDSTIQQPETISSTPSAAKLKFRKAAHAIAAAQKIVSGSTPDPVATAGNSSRYQWNAASSMEPGVNPHQPQPQLAHLSSVPALIDVVDYTEEQAEFTSFQVSTASELANFNATIARPRPSWSRVRWINVNGLNWGVIQSLAIQYSLHPLAVEDCVHTSARSKSEYYKHHLFVHAAVHTLHEDHTTDPTCIPKPTHNPFQKDNSDPNEEELLGRGILRPDLEASGNNEGPPHRAGRRQFSTTMMDLGSVTTRPGPPGKREVFDVEREVVRRLTKDYKVRIQVEKLSIFLLRGGTLITFFSRDGSRTVVPLLDRLRSSDTLLRSTSDASMLLQAVLDIIVDQALDVVEAFRSRLTSLEAAVLVNPKLDSVRHLHVLSGELLLLKRTLTPLSSLVHGIRNHDPSGDGTTANRSTRCSSSAALDTWDDSQSMRTNPPTLSGFVSPQARVYLSDVLDHIDSLLSSLELFSGWASNLVDFAFNTMSFSTNESMKQLSIVTIIFLPLTFLTGYFGMNFVDFSAIQGSDLFFWKLAVPVTLLLMLAFTYDRILRALAVQRSTVRLKAS